MTIRLTRGRATVAGAVLATVLGIASVASACVPGGSIVFDKFDVREGTPGSTTIVREGKLGDPLRAYGTSIDKPNWPYQVKLVVKPWDLNKPSQCGDLGIPQTIAYTTPMYPQYPNMWFSGKFDAPFTLNPGVERGPAHFCALAGWNKDGAWLTGALEMYIFEPFTVV